MKTTMEKNREKIQGKNKSKFTGVQISSKAAVLELESTY